jgi:hypothetical protein
MVAAQAFAIFPHEAMRGFAAARPAALLEGGPPAA